MKKVNEIKMYIFAYEKFSPGLFKTNNEET